MIINFEKPYIKVGRYKINLVKGDYILDNGACLQFIPYEEHYRKNFNNFVLYHPVPWRVSKTELKRLYKNYKFDKVTTETDGMTLTKIFYMGVLVKN